MKKGVKKRENASSAVSRAFLPFYTGKKRTIKGKKRENFNEQLIRLTLLQSDLIFFFRPSGLIKPFLCVTHCLNVQVVFSEILCSQGRK